MSRKKKLIEKAKRTPKQLRFYEFDTLLRLFGFYRVKTNAGSHMKWTHPSGIRFSAPRKNPMKPIYVLKLLQILNHHFPHEF